MKIKNIKVYKIDIPLKEGAYKWAHNNKVEKFDWKEVKCKWIDLLS